MFEMLILLVILSLVAILFFALKRDRFGKKPLFSAIGIFAFALIATFIYGSQPASESDYAGMAETFGYEQYVNGEVEEGTTVEVSGSAVSLTGDTVPEDELFILESADGAYYIKNSTGKEINNGDDITLTGNYSGIGTDDSPAINAHFIK